MKPIEKNNYGRLTITKDLGIVQSGKKRHRTVEAHCQCGVVKTYRLARLKSGHTRSCGCYSAEKRKIEDRPYGLLNITKEVESIRSGGKSIRAVEAKCQCGTVKIYRLSKLRRGHTKSCGCLRVKMAIEGNKSRAKHGMHDTTLYSRWRGIIDRCYQKTAQNYRLYGARGIGMCEQWRNDFQPFYDWCMENGYKRSLQIDRIDTNGDYEPANCRFVTPEVNNRNKRNSYKYYVEGGIYGSAKSAGEAIGIGKTAMMSRVSDPAYPNITREPVYE